MKCSTGLSLGVSLGLAMACGSGGPAPSPAPSEVSVAPVAPAPAARPAPPSAAPPAPSGDTLLLVLAQEDTREAAQARLTELQSLLDGVEEVFPLQEGFPLVLESAAVGLPPGRFVALAGACPVQEADVQRAALLALFPGSDAPRASWTRAEPACPDLGESPGQGRGYYAPTVARAGRLQVAAFPHVYVEDGGEWETKRWTALALLRDATGALVAVEQIDSRGAFSVLGGAVASGEAVVVTDSWSQDTCMAGQPIEILQGKTTVRARGDKIAVETADTHERDEPCSSP